MINKWILLGLLFMLIGGSVYAQDGTGVTVHDPTRTSPGYTLLAPLGSNQLTLIDMDGNPVWNIETELLPGNDIELLDDGTILGLFIAPDNPWDFGGVGGTIQTIDANGDILTQFPYYTEDYSVHHDIEPLPNGNILLLVTYKISIEETIEAGRNPDDLTEVTEFWPERIVEVNPETFEVVWVWDVMDHIVQDWDSSKPNYDSVTLNPQLVDINYPSMDSRWPELLHTNGLDYDVDKDVIYLSVHKFSEIWVIDHSTTTKEAASHEGGHYGVGGDLVYRFGNPQAFGNFSVPAILGRQHWPKLIEGDHPGAGNILVYSNYTNEAEQSTVYELALPEQLTLSGDYVAPEVMWSFTHPDLFAPFISGADRLSNGNTLIAEGDWGYWEVTPNGDVVWQYYFAEQGDFGSMWRPYRYEAGDPRLEPFGLE
jgi:hypothetical protein